MLSVVQLWEGVGATNQPGWAAEVLKITHSGSLMILCDTRREGTGAFELRFMSPAGTIGEHYCIYKKTGGGASSLYGREAGVLLSATDTSIRFTNPTVLTDLIFVMYFGVILRSEQ